MENENIPLELLNRKIDVESEILVSKFTQLLSTGVVVLFSIIIDIEPKIVILTVYSILLISHLYTIYQLSFLKDKKLKLIEEQLTLNSVSNS